MINKRVKRAIGILASLGMPNEQQNDRSALCLLALIGLGKNGKWKDLSSPLMGVTPIMQWIKDEYGVEYAPNTRETFRRQTLHQFVEGGIAAYNPDDPSRAVNSPRACYQIIPETKELLETFGSSKWSQELSSWKEKRQTLTEKYAQERDMAKVPLSFQGKELLLSPGHHSELIANIVGEFAPRFAPNSSVVYIGDTGAKEDFFDISLFSSLGVTLDRKGKLPDVVLYQKKNNWLFLIEAVTSHGPVDNKRIIELKDLFEDASAGLVFVTCFPNRSLMSKYLASVAWETEIWVADAPDHMVHMNGDRFLGPR
jgi:adenine-specific DNA-methyltransferase